MEIKYLGHSSFRLKTKGLTVVTDPYDTAVVGLSFPKTAADVVTISHEHKDHNSLEKIENEPRVFRGPGEYGVGGIRIYGYQTFHDANGGAERGTNTMFKFNIEGVNILHCGDLGHELSDKVTEEIGDVDVILIPVGGHFTIDAKEAHKIVRKVEPKLVIPMHYKVKGMSTMFNELTDYDTFLKEMNKKSEEEPKISVTKDSLPNELDVVVLAQS